ncbi:MAG: hypothetical protein B7Y20_06720 [Acidovorax sp. 16-64-162]|jgi:hypothetical protein|nr:MAG: hypothetical protein B7Y20_06720 [Acidovorax sp. 16-64-162]
MGKTLRHPPEPLRVFPPLSQRCALRAGERPLRGGAALARGPLAWAAPVSCVAGGAYTLQN